MGGIDYDEFVAGYRKYARDDLSRDADRFADSYLSQEERDDRIRRSVALSGSSPPGFSHAGKRVVMTHDRQNIVHIPRKYEWVFVSSQEPRRVLTVSESDHVRVVAWDDSSGSIARYGGPGSDVRRSVLYLCASLREPDAFFWPVPLDNMPWAHSHRACAHLMARSGKWCDLWPNRETREYSHHESRHHLPPDGFISLDYGAAFRAASIFYDSYHQGPRRITPINR